MDIFAPIFRAVFDNCNEGIVISDSNNKIIAVNPAFTKLMGFTLEEILGQNGSLSRSGRHDDKFYADLWDSVKTKGRWEGEIWVRRKDNAVFLEWLVMLAMKGIDGAVTHYISLFSDITESKTSAERIHFLANYDPLTELPNVRNLKLKLEAYINTTKDFEKIAIYTIGLDRFKNINLMVGFLGGDILLQIIANRLKEKYHSKEIIARISHDKFIVVVPNIANEEMSTEMATELLLLISEPCTVEDHIITSTASIGICIYPTDGMDLETLLNNSDTGMFAAKNLGGNTFQYFTAEMNARAVEKLQLEKQLKLAIQNNSFELYYQPIVDLKTKLICGVEALIRLNLPNLPSVSPGKFIPIAEDSGLIIPITEWVLKTACEENNRWIKAGLPIIPVAINISSKHFQQKNFKESIITLLTEYHLSPENLKLEITEGVMMSNVDETLVVLHKLKSLGIKFAIDDFGTGYSSLSYLKRFPLNDLKIDQSFIRDITKDVESDAIVKTIIGLAKNLKLRVIAEGVETKEQVDFLMKNDCDTIQGWYFSKAVTSEELMEMLKDKKMLDI